MKNLTEEEFDRQFNVIPDAEGESIRPDPGNVALDSKHLWTVVEADGSLYVQNGPHFVNRFGYLITEEPWTEETEAVWYLASDEEDDEGADLKEPADA